VTPFITSEVLYHLSYVGARRVVPASAASPSTPAAEDGVPGLKRLAPELRDLRGHAAELGQQTTAMRTRASDTCGLRGAARRVVGPAFDTPIRWSVHTLHLAAAVVGNDLATTVRQRKPVDFTGRQWACGLRPSQIRRLATTLTARGSRNFRPSPRIDDWPERKTLARAAPHRSRCVGVPD